MNSLALRSTCLLCALLLPGPLAAQQRPAAQPVHLTLDDAIARALDASHRVRELRARQEGARATLEGRQAADRPLVSVQAGYTRTNHVEPFGVGIPGRAFEIIYPDIPDNYRTRLDLQWPIYTFGRTDALERLARAEADATGKDVEAARADLRLETTRAFWAAVTARESVRVLEESVKRMDAALADVRNRQQVGLVPPNDVLSVQAQRSRQNMLRIQAQNQLDQVTADLARLVGLPADTRIETDATLDAGGRASSAPTGGAQPSVGAELAPPQATGTAQPSVGAELAPPQATGTAQSSVGAELAPPQSAVASTDLTALVAQARSARPDRQALASRVREAAERREAARAGRRPTLALAGGVDYARPNPRIFPRIGEFRESWDATINFSWLLWDGGRVRADIAEATASQHAIAERLADFDAALDVEVRQRYLDVHSTRAAVAAAQDSVAAATEARRVVSDRFANGVATSTEVLDAHVALLQAELDRTQALASVKLAEARLNRVLGR